MKFQYWQLVTVKQHPSLHTFYGKNKAYFVVNFRPIKDGERQYLIQPEGTPNKYRVNESNLELVGTEEWPA